MKSQKTILAFILSMTVSVIYAQEAVLTTGGDSSSSSGSLAYSVGQVVYTTNSNNDGTVSKGVQQAFEIFTLSIDDNRLDILLSVYPNPTTSHINLRIDDQLGKDLSYQLYDLRGRLLRQGDITDNITQINMQKLQSATYLINILQNNKRVKSFKVIKAE